MANRKTILEIAFLVVAAIYLTCFDIVVVDGSSMLPSYQNGQRLLSGLPLCLKSGDVVVVKYLDEGTHTYLLKRIHWVNDKEVYLLGDNSLESLDSRDLGPFPRASVVGKIVFPIVSKD